MDKQLLRIRILLVVNTLLEIWLVISFLFGLGDTRPDMMMSANALALATFSGFLVMNTYYYGIKLQRAGLVTFSVLHTAVAIAQFDQSSSSAGSLWLLILHVILAIAFIIATVWQYRQNE